MRCHQQNVMQWHDRDALPSPCWEITLHAEPLLWQSDFHFSRKGSAELECCHPVRNIPWARFWSLCHLCNLESLYWKQWCDSGFLPVSSRSDAGLLSYTALYCFRSTIVQMTLNPSLRSIHFLFVLGQRQGEEGWFCGDGTDLEFQRSGFCCHTGCLCDLGHVTLALCLRSLSM